MANFCVKCGAPFASGSFCVKCGADMRSIGAGLSKAPQEIVQMPTTKQAQPPTPAPTKQGMSALAKLGIAAVAIIFVGGAAGAVGVYYVAHRVSQKIHQAADGVLGSGSDSSTTSHGEGSGLGRSESERSAESGTMGDVCRLLSKEDVSKAIGVEIIRAQPEDNGCSYIAKGTQADMTAKHVTAMAKDKGADAQTQKMVQTFAGTLFNTFQEQHPNEHADQNGEVPVFVFSIDNQSAEVQMRLTAKTFGNLGPGPQGLPGIGDQAFDMGNAMIMVRKGDKLIHIMYTTCPCSTEQVKPLAKKLADSL
jgi:hypothetical protein